MTQFAELKKSHDAIPTAKSIREDIVKSLVIDGCSMSDETFASILEGVTSQKELEELRYSSNYFGEKSLAVFREAMDQFNSDLLIRKLQLTNLYNFNPQKGTDRKSKKFLKNQKLKAELLDALNLCNTV